MIHLPVFPHAEFRKRARNLPGREAEERRADGRG